MHPTLMYLNMCIRNIKRRNGKQHNNSRGVQGLILKNGYIIRDSLLHIKKMDRSSRQNNKETVDLKNSINQVNLTDI